MESIGIATAEPQIAQPTISLKDWLGYEQQRNKRNADLYTRLIKRALSKLIGRTDVSVLIGHHLTFELGADLNTENEIPSADCLIFDHDLMTAVFGDAAMDIMQRLAIVPCDERDLILGHLLDRLEAN